MQKTQGSSVCYQDFLFQSGDPTGTGTGGDSLYGLLYGPLFLYVSYNIAKSLSHFSDILF
jgi:peptidyl-prolyl cis-trans isomerase-like 4